MSELTKIPVANGVEPDPAPLLAAECLIWVYLYTVSQGPF